MESIERLREWVDNNCCLDNAEVINDHLDAIEREVEELRDREYRNGVEDGEMVAERDGWVRLPLDTEGVPFHIGELVDEKLPFGGYAAPAPIDTMELYRGASGYGWMVKLDAESRALISPKLLRHHRAPTVEDVLDEFASAYDRIGGADDEHQRYLNLIAEYAAKLRLAGDE